MGNFPFDLEHNKTISYMFKIVDCGAMQKPQVDRRE